ncbi:Serine/threonine-protein kinase StkP [Rubripirellula lacrimiformis]|uniref:Serine/threonine-protein kinase StkP n=1 Tax=Rubripirellula lacrimiformis TaxID=1930273 RepID=A0A517N8X0_9BACT|nr:serine/threonine-protein kinase [Rubripirellula lacrimiformis]QDT03562.1 Serine/threonine-protein kinase StkP [Rubripirellula lacrimiformis]
MTDTSLYDFLEPPTQAGDLGVLGHYRVISELGRGGMGFVFRAEDIKLKRSVALKVMNQKIAAVPNSRKRFLSEARAMAAVHHDNVATIFEVGESKGTPFMAMEMLAGQTLEKYNKTHGQIDFETVIEFAMQTARGLAAAHAKGIVHRDIKPANIWIQEGTDRIKILDFGLALASSPVDQLAGRGAVIGTPGYLAPEQARSDPMDDRSDLYSLGVVLYEMCTGKLPIQAKSVPGQLVSILAHRPLPIQELNPQIPQPLCDLIHKLLRKEPRSRPRSAEQLQVELARVEVECQKSTETALAINRLKEGLSEVVTKKSASGGFDAVGFESIGFDSGSSDEIEVVHDPLANLPAAPVVGLPSAVMTPPMSAATRPTKPVADGPAWHIYLPIAAIVAVVFVALPVLTFYFSSAGRSTEAYVVDLGNEPANVTGNVNSPSGGNPPKGNAGENQGQPNQQTSSPQPVQQQTQTKPPRDNDAGGSGKPQTPKQNGQGGRKNRKNDPKAGPDPAENSNSAGSDSEMESGAESSPSESGQPRSPGIDASPTDASPADATRRTDPSVPDPLDSAEPPVSPAVPTKWVAISTADGRGADAMVQNSGSDKLGERTTIGLRTRNGIEVTHSYLRFDLSQLKDTRAKIDKAGLILTVVGSKRPVDATIRVYGISEVGKWDESKLEWESTPSWDKAVKQIHQYPLLAEVTVDEMPADVDRDKNQIRISDPRLAKFLAEEGDLVTFGLAGEHGSMGMRFVSREKSSQDAPQLLVEVPLP